MAGGKGRRGVRSLCDKKRGELSKEYEVENGAAALIIKEKRRKRYEKGRG